MGADRIQTARKYIYQSLIGQCTANQSWPLTDLWGTHPPQPWTIHSTSKIDDHNAPLLYEINSQIIFPSPFSPFPCIAEKPRQASRVLLNLPVHARYPFVQLADQDLPVLPQVPVLFVPTFSIFHTFKKNLPKTPPTFSLLPSL